MPGAGIIAGMTLVNGVSIYLNWINLSRPRINSMRFVMMGIKNKIP
jgi:hypothetical protein